MESSLVNNESSSQSSSFLRFSLDVIKRATNEFAEENSIESGGYWEVYRGNISDDSNSGEVAIFRYRQSPSEKRYLYMYFLKEIEVLTACHHPNIVSLLGICDEEDEKIIVYDFMPNGFLYDFLYKHKQGTTPLTVEQRLEICIGVAKGLAYLHSDTHGYHFIHFALEPRDIILDASLVPKISGFGLSKTRAAGPSSSQQITKSQLGGTKEYRAPECYEGNYKPSRKADVYAFGVVLLELLCERPAWKRLLILALPFVMRGELPKITPEHVRKNISPKCGRACEQLIRDCLEYEKDKRPDMNQVVSKLELALKFQKQKIMSQPNTQQQSSSVNKCSKRFSLAEIQRATNNYSNALGKGGQAEVFYGSISEESNNLDVAVKCMNLETNEGIQAFEIERILLSACHHANIISLVGFCDEGDTKILVYEFMPNGSLHDYLYKRKEGSSPLTVEQRLGICIGVAKGLDYLHSQKGYNEVIVHSDIKTDNILLDIDFVPKISDFGLSRTRVTNQSTMENVTYTVRGTQGYIAPECYDQHMVSRKADVYAFGVVFLEVLSEKPAWEQLVIWAQPFLFKGEFPMFVPEYVRKNISRECSRACVNLIRDCLENDPNNRPSMDKVIANLEFALTLQKMNLNANSQNNHFQAISQKIFSISEIETLTNEPKQQIAIGYDKLGRFYRGNMPIELAMKHVNFTEMYTIQSFQNEIDLLSSCHHPNVISLLGYCDDPDKKTLVFEFMPNGSLYKYIFRRHDSTPRMTIEERLEICLGVAKGLNYLHYGTSFTIIHKFLSSHNILLDGNLVAKISGFELSIKCAAGLSKVKEYRQLSKGIRGYIAPECYEHNILTPKTDVYAFGVILLEVLCEKKSSQELLGSALPFLMIGELPKFAPEQVQKNISLECSRACANLIRDCVDNDPNNRPSTYQVVDRLESALNVQNQGAKIASQLTGSKPKRNASIQSSSSPEKHLTNTPPSILHWNLTNISHQLLRQLPPSPENRTIMG